MAHIDNPGAVLGAATRTALLAPSIFNTQPWRWRIAGETAELYADPSRQLRVADPLARMLTVSCGVALHHARVALATARHGVLVERWPAAGEPDLVARLRLVLSHEPTAAERAMFRAIPLRRTDRRAFRDTPVPAAVLDQVRAAAMAEGAALHVIRDDQLAAFAVAVARAADLEMVDPDYRSELIRWTNRPPWSGDGVPPTTAVRPGHRRVPPREFSLSPERGMDPGSGTDRGAVFAVLTGRRDDSAGWLRGGEALSAVLLTATAQGLSTAPISDVIEVASTREQLHRILGRVGFPYVAIRLGYRHSIVDPPAVPRRPVREVVDYTG